MPDIQESTSPQYNPTSLDNIKWVSKQDLRKWYKNKLPLKLPQTINHNFVISKTQIMYHHYPFKLSRVGTVKLEEDFT